jgi:hypothetical protein
MKCTIKKGTIVRQDFTWFEWKDDQMVFIASEDINDDYRKCLANGYGSFMDGESYGNGCLYVKDCDLIIGCQKKQILMPESLTAENGAKSLLIGEFHETISIECSKCYGDGCEACNDSGFENIKVIVSWPTIKKIYAKVVDHFSHNQTTPDERIISQT